MEVKISLVKILANCRSALEPCFSNHSPLVYLCLAHTVSTQYLREVEGYRRMGDHVKKKGQIVNMIRQNSDISKF